MIIDLKRFTDEEKPYWEELESMLSKIDSDPAYKMDINKAKRFHYLYQRTSSGLSKVSGCSSQADIRLYLENLVGRAYAEIHETRRNNSLFSFAAFFFKTFPVTFRRHFAAFMLCLAITVAGMTAGGLAITFDKEAKAIIIPFEHLEQTPGERVAKEEQKTAGNDDLKGTKATFSAYLMTHNIRVSIATFAFGLSFGIGTIITLFYNGIILGAVILDYVMSGKAVFLTGWLLPHGSVEIPSILIAGQAGFILTGAIIGWGKRIPLRQRLKKVSKDIITLISGLAVLLVWAGIIEAFFSQYHEPVLPYALKIAFGCVQLIGLTLFLALSGKNAEDK